MMDYQDRDAQEAGIDAEIYAQLAKVTTGKEKVEWERSAFRAAETARKLQESADILAESAHKRQHMLFRSQLRFERIAEEQNEHPCFFKAYLRFKYY